MSRETVPKLLPDMAICQGCKIGFSLYMTYLSLRNVRLIKEYMTSLELAPCDFVALLLDPKDREELESGSYLDLVRNCFHQCLALFKNGVSDHVLETILGYDLISQRDKDYIS